MREIAVGVSLGRDALITLEHMHIAPGDVVLSGEHAQHDPRCRTAADSHHETPAFGGRCACFFGDQGRCPSRDRVRISKHLDLHASPLAQSYPTFGFCQPPGGTTFPSTSRGPQLPASYS